MGFWSLPLVLIQGTTPMSLIKRTMDADLPQRFLADFNLI